MDDDRTDTLVEYLRDAVGDDLRSVVRYDYDDGDYDVVYAREGVLDEYADDEIEKIVRTYETDTLSKAGNEQWYTHGEQRCVLRCFEDGVELNLLGDGEGIAVGFDGGVLAGPQSFVGNCLRTAGLD